MPKWSSYFTRFLLVMCLFILILTGISYGLSSYFFHDIYTGATYNSLKTSVHAARQLLADYRDGEMDREALHAAVNPVVDNDGAFYMLLDKEKEVLTYTESAVPYFVSAPLPTILDALREEGAMIVHNQAEGTTALLMGEKVPGGYVLAGRPMRIFTGAAHTFRNRMLISMAVVLLLILLLSIFAARRVSRPARMITEMAARLTDGEQLLLPENLPGQEVRQIAKALNHMSRTVAKSIQELRHERDIVTLVMEGLSEGILAIDTKGNILHENTAAQKLLGGPDTPAYRAVMDMLREETDEPHWEEKFNQGDSILNFDVSCLPAGEGEKSRGTVALIRDITEQERLERTRHDYVANISHELRTPLASIRGLGEGLRDGFVTEEKDRVRYYHIIVNEATRLSRLVNDLLELSSLQSNPAAFEMEKVDPNELIYDLHDRNATLFAKKSISFDRQLPDGFLPDIISNEDRLSQVLTIFLDNARKYTPDGGTVILGAEKAGEGVRFFVRDTGIGMDEETRKLAFERFHQAEKGRSDKGSGLGLSIAREVLQKMGIAIELKSEQGKGSEFSFVVEINSLPDAGV